VNMFNFSELEIYSASLRKLTRQRAKERRRMAARYRVQRAIDELESNGQALTYRAVRKLAKSSYSTIAKLLREYNRTGRLG
jgi:hypothetical protein